MGLTVEADIYTEVEGRNYWGFVWFGVRVVWFLRLG
jgi:hypothetical protein